MLGSSTRQVTGIVLAGGHSRRLGRDKAVEEIGGIRIIDRVIETLNNCCENILVIGDRPERRSELSLPGNVMFEHDTNIGIIYRTSCFKNPVDSRSGLRHAFLVLRIN